MSNQSPARPGAVLRAVRTRRDWTLAEVSRRTGFPVSTLSKMENDRVSLTYDKLTRLSEGLGVDISLFFSGLADASEPTSTPGRRSITRAGDGRSIESKTYSHIYPAADLLSKKMIPILVDLRAKTLAEFGELVRHTGEEFILVLEGTIEVHTSLYAPVRLATGDSVYLDSSMGHAYVAVGTGPCRILAMCSASESQLIAAVGGIPTDLESQKTKRLPAKRARKMAKTRR
ncbi:MAG: XRE family transcriptional regulator [Pseudomonadota bacterium]